MKGCRLFALAFLLLSSATARATEDSAPAQAPAKKPPVAPASQTPGDAPASVEQLEAAVKRDPGNPKLHVALGLAYWDRNDSPRALGAFQRAVKVGPSSAEAHNWLGVALAEKADLPGAIAALRKAVELDPTYGRAYTNLGATLVKSGDFAEAVAVFEKALALEPNSLAAHTNLGMALREKGDTEAALEHLRRVACWRSGQRRRALRAGADAAAERRSGRRRCRLREGAREGPRAARGLLRAWAGAETTERFFAKAACPGRKPRKRSVHTRAGTCRTWRAERCPRATHPGHPSRREACGGAQPARLHAGPAGRSARRRSATSSARLRCDPNPPRRTTTLESRCGTAEARIGR